MKHRYSFYLLLCICIFSVFSCSKKKENDGAKEYLEVENKIDTLIEKGELIGAELLIIERDQEAFHKSFGWADRETDNYLENGSVWTIMSMTKPFTATAILMLIDDGKLSFDDSIRRFIPDFKGDARITIRNLLEQSSGDDGKHGNGGHNVTQFETLEDWVSDWAEHESTGNIGEFIYSNFNYGALAYVVQQISGKTIDEFFKERIIKPLGLENTYLKYDLGANWTRKVPSRYEWSEARKVYDRFWSNTEHPSWKFVSGSLGLWMTARDYATFMQMWLNEGRHQKLQLLKKSTVKEALEIQVNAYGEEHFGHGYGWFVEDNPLVFRYGGSAGGLAKAVVTQELIAIYMTHCGNNRHKSVVEDAIDKVWFPEHN